MGPDYADWGWAWKSAFEPPRRFRCTQSTDDAGLRGNLAPWPKLRRNPVGCHYSEDHNLLTRMKKTCMKRETGDHYRCILFQVNSKPSFSNSRTLQLYGLTSGVIHKDLLSNTASSSFSWCAIILYFYYLSVSSMRGNVSLYSLQDPLPSTAPTRKQIHQGNDILLFHFYPSAIELEGNSFPIRAILGLIWPKWLLVTPKQTSYRMF